MILETVVKIDDNNKITIPTLYINKLKLEKGDEIRISVDDEQGVITIKKAEE